MLVTINWYERTIMSWIQHYNHEKYWKMRKTVIDPKSKVPKLLKLWMLFRIKRMDAFNGSSMGTYLNYGTYFEEPPTFPHGIRGIFVSNEAKIGKGAIIHQQVTIGGYKGSPTIGDNCFIGAGAKIIGPVKIGDNVKIGSNCIVVEDIPDNATVVMHKPRIIVKSNNADTSF